MADKSYFDRIPEDIKRDIAFNIVASIREAISIAQKKSTPPTYEQALKITYDLDEDLYDFCSKELQSKTENDVTKLYKERAKAESAIRGKNIEPEDLIVEDIDKHRDYLIAPGLSKEDSRFLRTHVAALEAALENLQPRKLSEHRILERDFCKIDRSFLGAEKIFEKDNSVDYKISDDRFLRLRMLHPDIPEHILGADLIYEFYEVETEMVRIMVLQYKVWDKGVLYFSSAGNMEQQLLKLKSNFCDKGFCAPPKSLDGRVSYRFPFCCAFLRPTDKIQNPDSKMVSSGIHIPVCSALEIKNDTGGKIEKNQIRHTALTHEIFEHLFNHYFIGSRFVHYTELEDFYKEMKVFNKYDTIKIYAKEILTKKVA